MDNNYDNTEQFERIEQYLDDKLDSAERQRFEQQLQQDAALAAAVENVRATRKAIQAYGLRQEVAGIRNRMQQHKVKKGLLYYGLRAAAAAVLLIAVTAVYQYFSLSPERLYEERSAPYSLRATRSGEKAPAGITAEYQAGDMQRTVQAFGQLNQPGAADYFLAGNAYLQLGRGADAIPCFQKAQQSPALREDAEYYLALSYLQQKDLTHALPLFRQIRSNEAHPYHNRVSTWFYWQLRLLDWKQ
jgi:tetratricopeptide (TPR) repeat protein